MREQLGSPPAQPVRDAVAVQGRSAEEDLPALHDASNDAAQEHDHDADLREQLQGTDSTVSVSSNTSTCFYRTLLPLHCGASSR